MDVSKWIWFFDMCDCYLNYILRAHTHSHTHNEYHLLIKFHCVCMVGRLMMLHSWHGCIALYIDVVRCIGISRAIFGKADAYSSNTLSNLLMTILHLWCEQLVWIEHVKCFAKRMQWNGVILYTVRPYWHAPYGAQTARWIFYRLKQRSS